jgi:hypothetical protein
VSHVRDCVGSGSGPIINNKCKELKGKRVKN